MMNFALAAYLLRQEFLAECDRIYRQSLPSECERCGSPCPCVGRTARVLKSSIEDGERLANALRRVKDSLATFDLPTYSSARAYAGQVLLMRQAVDAALNPSGPPAPVAQQGKGSE